MTEAAVPGFDVRGAVCKESGRRMGRRGKGRKVWDDEEIARKGDSATGDDGVVLVRDPACV